MAMRALIVDVEEPESSPDLSAFDAENVRRYARCTVGLAVEVMTAEHRANFHAAMARRKDGDWYYSAEAIARVVRSWGYRIPGNTIARHRRGSCQCPKT